MQVLLCRFKAFTKTSSSQSDMKNKTLRCTKWNEPKSNLMFMPICPLICQKEVKMDQMSAAVQPGQDTDSRLSSFQTGLNKYKEYLIFFCVQSLQRQLCTTAVCRVKAPQFVSDVLLFCKQWTRSSDLPMSANYQG